MMTLEQIQAWRDTLGPQHPHAIQLEMLIRLIRLDERAAAQAAAVELRKQTTSPAVPLAPKTDPPGKGGRR